MAAPAPDQIDSGAAPCREAGRPYPGVRLVAAVALVAVLLTAVGLILARRNERAARTRVIDQTVGLAGAAAADTDRLLRDRLDLLTTIAAAPSVRLGDPSAMDVYFTYLAARQPHLDRIAWINLYGFRQAAARAGPPGEFINVADRDYFRAVVATGRSFAGAVTVAPADARPTLPLVVPTWDTEGTLSGVFEGGITVEQLAQTLAGFAIDPAITVMMLDRADQLIGDGDASTGAGPAADTSLVARARGQGAGVDADATDPRGVGHRLAAFAPVSACDCVLFMSRPADEAFAPSRSTYRAEAAALISVALAGLLGAIWAGRRLDRLALEQRRALHASEALARENEGLYHQAKAAVQARDDVLSNVSHDLKTPVTVIKTQAQLLQRQLARLNRPDMAFALEGLASIDSTTTRLTAMIGEMLDLAQLQIGQPLDLQPNPTDLVVLVRARVEAHQKAATRHQLVVEADVPKLVGTWDPVRLERVIDNLLSNAIKYSPSGGPIALSVAREGAGKDDKAGGWAVLSVHDRGVGIPAADLPRVFERFHRATNVSGRIEGSGIGLAGAKQIVEQHGGTMTIDSQEGKGTTVSVRLPMTNGTMKDAG